MARLIDAVRRATILNAVHPVSMSGDICSFNADNTLKLPKLTANIEAVQSGGGDPSLDNIRPITGWTGANIYDDPKYGGTIEWNQRNGNATSTSTGGGVTFTNNGDGSWTLTNNGTGTYRKLISSPSSISVGDIVFFCHGASVAGSSSTFYVCFSRSGMHLEGNTDIVGRVMKCEYAFDQFSIRTFSGFRPPEGGLVLKPMWCNLTQMFGAEEAERIYNLEGYGSHGVEYFRSLFPNDYYAYNSGTKTIVSAVSNLPHTSIPYDWTDTAGTVYAGTLDIVNGILTPSKQYFKGLGSDFRTNGGFRCLRTTFSTANYSMYEPVISNMFSFLSSGGFSNPWQVRQSSSGVLYWSFPTDYTDEQILAVSPNVEYLLYRKIAARDSYQLTPSVIRALIGQNHFWADSGSMDLTYWKHN